MYKNKVLKYIQKLNQIGSAVPSPVNLEPMFARISSSLPHKIVAFAGGPMPHTIFNSIKTSLIPMFNTKTVLPLRVVSKEIKEDITATKWHDKDTNIYNIITLWKTCFPLATAANCSRSVIKDNDCINFRGLLYLNITGCLELTDAAFVHLIGIHTLNMSSCWDSMFTDTPITDVAFANLRGIHTLDISMCNQETITDAAFANLHGIHTLNMSGCNQPTITNAAFANLQGIHTLNMSSCSQETITDAAFVNLQGINTLDMSRCDQYTITGNTFVNLVGIKLLKMAFCRPEPILAAIRLGLNVTPIPIN